MAAVLLLGLLGFVGWRLGWHRGLRQSAAVLLEAADEMDRWLRRCSTM
jgi:hypothetical protein